MELKIRRRGRYGWAGSVVRRRDGEYIYEIPLPARHGSYAQVRRFFLLAGTLRLRIEEQRAGMVHGRFDD